MNRFVSLVWLALISAGLGQTAKEEEPPPLPGRVTNLLADSYARSREEALHARWNVRIEVAMIGIPQERYFKLVPELREPGKIEGVFAQLVAAISRQEAVLLGWPILQMLDGQRAQNESLNEKRYPVEFEAPQGPQAAGNSRPSEEKPAVEGDFGMPRSFETRNIGVTLEAEPRVLANGEWIYLSLVPQRIELLGYDHSTTVVSKRGQVVRIPLLQIFYWRTQSELKVRNGERMLLGVHLLTKPENFVELVFLQVFATEVGVGAGKP